MRVLFSSTAGLGHIHPMVPLAQALLERGHEVLWATGTSTAAHLRKSGFDAVASGMDAGPRSTLYRTKYPDAELLPPRERPAHGFAKLFGEIGVPEMLRDLLSVAKTWEPSLLIHDQAEFAGPLAASILGATHITHSYGGLLPAWLLENAGLEVAPLWREHGLEVPPLAGCYDHLYIDIYPPSMQSPEINLVPVRQLARPVAFAGEDDRRSLSDVMALDGRPLVYLTFGTESSINKAFRLALETIRDFDVQLLVTVGPDGDAASFGKQPPNVRIERYISQTLILDHCQVVVSHAGSGTVLAAMARGIPQLCLPQGADQFGNAYSCERVGAGLQVQPGHVDPLAISGAFERLMSEPGFRSCAHTMAREIAAMPSPSEVAAVLEKFAA